MTELYLILLFMIAASVIAVEMRDLVSSIVAVGAVGIGLSMAFLLLKAPDLAMLQIVVEILSLIILIRATIKKDLPFSASGRWLFNTIVTVCFVGVFLFFALIAFKDLPAFGNPLMNDSAAYIAAAQTDPHIKNVVAAIILKYRVFDTVGEIAVFFAAVVGALAIARGIGYAKEKKNE